MERLEVAKLKEILTQAQLTIYEVDTPNDLEEKGFKFDELSSFVSFVKNNNIKNCFLYSQYSTIDEYLILDEMIEESFDLDGKLGKKIIREAQKYNKTLESVDFSIPEMIIIVVIYEGSWFYYEHFNELIIGNEELKTPEEKLDDILEFYENEINEENDRRSKIIEEQKEKLKLYIQNDSNFKLCKNKSLRRNYILELFNKKLGEEFKELKNEWNTRGTGFLYRKAFEVTELVWNELKSKPNN